MKFSLYPYKMGSNSARVLSEALDCFQIKHSGSKFKGWSDPKRWVINWGSSQCPSGASVLNSSLNVSRAGNKLSYFQLVKEYCRVPEFTTSKAEAKGWFSSSASAKGLAQVVARCTLTGHSGEGIEIAERPDDLKNAPLYTRYIPKDSEYRLHFISGHDGPFYIQKKVRKGTHEGDHNLRIRNLAGGYVYAHNDISVPEDVLKQGKGAFGHSALDFCAIDVIYNKRSEKAYVLEANCAPGLEGQTITAYKEAFMKVAK